MMLKKSIFIMIHFIIIWLIKFHHFYTLQVNFIFVLVIAVAIIIIIIIIIIIAHQKSIIM